MRFIEELVVEEFLPTFRSMLAEALRDRDLTQSEVADAVGVSRLAVQQRWKPLVESVGLDAPDW